MAKRSVQSEREIAHQVNRAAKAAYGELAGSHPHTALAIAGLGSIVEKVAARTPGWSGLASHRFFGKKGKVQ